MARTLSIEVVSDVVCPWCYIGLTQLEAALAARPDLQAELVFSPFQLDPSTPREGADIRERLRQRYGADPDVLFERVAAHARGAGLEIDFAKIRRSANTLGAHVLLESARARGTQVELARALFRAYFLEGRDVGDPDVLAAIAADHGFSEDEARARVDDDAERARVRARGSEQVARGVTGVPFFVVDDRYAVPGAQDAATWAKVLERVAPVDAEPAVP